MFNNLNDIKIIGAGTAGFELAKQLRAQNKDIKITLIDKSDYYFNKRNFIRTLDFKNCINLHDFCQNENITLIHDSVVRINADRNKIYFKEKEPIDYSFLVIATGVKSKDVSIKGEHREGLFYLSDIKPFEVKNLLKISTEIIIYVSTMLGLEFCVTLKNLGKEIRLLSNSLDFLSMHKDKIINLLNEKGIPLHLGVTIDEVIGEGQIRATKVTPLKVFSSQLVFVDSGFNRNLDFFESPISMTNIFNTPYENMYVLGDANRQDIENDYFYPFNEEESQSQADSFAQFILNSKSLNFGRKPFGNEEKDKLINDFLTKMQNVIVEGSAAGSIDIKKS